MQVCAVLLNVRLDIAAEITCLFLGYGTGTPGLDTGLGWSVIGAVDRHSPAKFVVHQNLSAMFERNGANEVQFHSVVVHLEAFSILLCVFNSR